MFPKLQNQREITLPDLEDREMGSPTAPSGQAAPSRKMFTTMQAARFAGVSEATVRRRRDELQATRMPDGGYLFDEAILRTKITTLRLRAVGSRVPGDGAIAAAVFDALQRGEEPTDIVIKLKVAPDLVLELVQKFRDLHASGVRDLLPRPGQPRQRRGRGVEFEIDGEWYPAVFNQPSENSLSQSVAHRTVNGQAQIFLDGRWVDAKEWKIPAFSKPGEFQALRSWLPLEQMAPLGWQESSRNA